MKMRSKKRFNCMKLEFNTKYSKNVDVADLEKQGIFITPPMGSDTDYLFKIQIADNQAIVGFPKFTTIGIGFLREDKDWNTNLPYQCDAETIYEHIKINKGCKVRKATCIKAIKMIQDAAKFLMEKN